jgi:hypothetical protein
VLLRVLEHAVSHVSLTVIVSIIGFPITWTLSIIFSILGFFLSPIGAGIAITFFELVRFGLYIHDRRYVIVVLTCYHFLTAGST